MNKLLLLFVFLFALPLKANAQQAYYRPYYEEQAMVNPEPVSYPYFLENRTGAPLTVYLYVNKVRWEFSISVNHEVPEVMLPLGAEIRVEGFADVGNNTGRKNKRVYTAFYLRQNFRGHVDRGWVFYH